MKALLLLSLHTLTLTPNAPLLMYVLKPFSLPAWGGAAAPGYHGDWVYHL